MPFETAKPNSERLLNWDGSYQASAYHKLNPGQWTDDTQMSLALTKSLLEKGYYDPASVARNYLAWYQGSPRGMGKNTAAAMQNLANDAPWHESGIVGAEGNGSAMRAAPLGAYFWRGSVRLASTAHWARVDAVISHNSREAKEGSVAIAVAVSHLCSGGSKETLIPRILEHLKPSNIAFSLKFIHTLMEDGEDFQQIIQDMSWGVNGIGAHVVASVPGAISCFLYSSDFQNCIESAIRAGGDTDSTAAMAGAMAGSFYGYEAIPERYKAGLEDAEAIRDLELSLLV